MSVKTKKVTKKVAVKKKVLLVGQLGRMPLNNGGTAWPIKRNKTSFVFGCGAVTLTHRDVELFLAELKRQRSITADQTRAYNKVLGELKDRLSGGTERLDPDKLKQFFFRKTPLKR